MTLLAAASRPSSSRAAGNGRSRGFASRPSSGTPGHPGTLSAVDDGPTDGTGADLEGIRDAAVPVTVVANRDNLGFPHAINRGLHEARGEYLVPLKNDAVVADGWLDPLVAPASMRLPDPVRENPDC